MKKMLVSFQSYMKSKGRSKQTIQAYSGDLREFIEYADSIQKTANQIAFRDLQSWMEKLEKRGLSASSRARKVSSLKSFFTYLLKIDEIEKNPAELLEKPHVPVKKPEVISRDSARNLLSNSIENINESFNSFRDYTIVAMFLYTGIRREELTNIKLSDISEKDGTILIHGKGYKERIVYIFEDFRPILSEYLNVYRKKYRYERESEYLFLSQKSKKLHPATINDIVNKAFETAGIKKSGVSAHVLRKCFATTLYNDGQTEITMVAEALGHSSTDVTRRYVGISGEAIRKFGERNVKYC